MNSERAPNRSVGGWWRHRVYLADDEAIEAETPCALSGLGWPSSVGRLYLTSSRLIWIGQRFPVGLIWNPKIVALASIRAVAVQDGVWQGFSIKVDLDGGRSHLFTTGSGGYLLLRETFPFVWARPFASSDTSRHWAVLIREASRVSLTSARFAEREEAQPSGSPPILPAVMAALTALWIVGFVLAEVPVAYFVLMSVTWILLVGALVVATK
jgi:hypothetical protein